MTPPEPARTTLDRYELVERIAVGGMAEVFRAKAFGAHGFEKVLAIKRILPDLARDPEFESRFISEAKLAVALSHANIVQVLDFGRFGGTLYIAMEFVDGPDLAALLRALHDRGERVPVSAALHIAMDLAKGLDFAHRNGVVHRDVSPSNILLSRGGEVKIADFGIAQAAESVAAASGVVRRIMGKWRYMSPEQARGETLDARSDLFSAGSVLYELFTGKKLFPGDEIEDVVRNVREMPIPPPSSVRPELPPALDAVLARCLERDPARRWATAGELHRALLELSYARSLVVTATDVSELIAEVLPPRAAGAPAAPLGGGASGQVGSSSRPGSASGSAGSGRGRGPRGVDDLIRAELFGGAGAVTDDDLTSEVSRVTAQVSGPVSDVATATTFVLRGVGPDGITQFEPGTTLPNLMSAAAQAPEIPSEPGPIPEAAVAASLLPAPDVAEVAAAPAGGESVRTTLRLPGRRPPSQAPTRLWLVGAAVLVTAAGGYGLWRTRGGAPAGPRDAAATPAPAVAPALLEVITEPPGAIVLIGGVQQPAPTPTVVTLPAAPGDHHPLELRLPGHRGFRGDVVVRAGERVRFERPLEAMHASLRVATVPAGAEVTLDGKPLGESPLSLAELPADGATHTLRLTRDGFLPVEVPVELGDGARVEVERTLEPEVRYGKLNLQVDPWAYVYFDGKRIAEAPVAGLKLPVGKQKLRLVNPAIHAEKNVVVDVPAKGVGTAAFSME